ncbi:hypothetical protein A0256_07850 [Mucilaginibacter sp. PAMC 26640]|nr:hypothetical protein A0256_07850 [Mucilaginibacter sp. PAMC 26640]
MRPIKSKLFFLLFYVGFALASRAQSTICTGSLGDPVINEDFGSGQGNGGPLPAGVTTYNYTSSTCPSDGSYTIASNTNNCFGGTWYTVLQDHTNNPNGRMMIINAALAKGEFFTQITAVGALCENTTYEFSAYVLNLILPSTCGGQSSQPNITFIIQTTTGQVLKTYESGDIPPTSSPVWVQKFTYFTTPPGVSEVVIKMVNNAPGGCGNDLLLDDITFRACGPIVQAGFAGTATVTQQNTCVGQSASYKVIATPGPGYNNASYQWQLNANDGLGWHDIPDGTQTTLDVIFIKAQLGTYQYRLGVAEGANIASLNCRVYSNPVTVFVSGYPVVPVIAPVSVCEGEVLTLTASGGAVYKWSGPNMPETTQNPLVIPNATPADAGKYTVIVISAQGCESKGGTDVVIKPKTVITVSDEQTICRGSNTNISASAANADSYSWLPVTGLSDPASPSPIAGPDVTTVYTVTVTGVNGCTSTAQVTVNVIDAPVANAGKDRKMSEGQSIQLEGSATGSILSYLWSPADYLDNPNSLTPTASPVNDITYTLTVTSANNCGINTSSVFIRVYKKVTIPNSFTPNSDGKNDTWNIEALETYAQSTTNVYNRNGQLVYNSIGYSKPWDGTFNGKSLTSGTYYYVIDLKNGSPLFSGWVLLLR